MEIPLLQNEQRRNGCRLGFPQEGLSLLSALGQNRELELSVLIQVHGKSGDREGSSGPDHPCILLFGVSSGAAGAGGNQAPCGALGRASLNLGSVICIRPVFCPSTDGNGRSQPKRRLLFYKCQHPNAWKKQPSMCWCPI